MPDTARVTSCDIVGGDAARPPEDFMTTHDCAACLGSRQCWVCLGNGRLEQPDSRVGITCRRCHGTAHCPICRAAKIQAA
jgi:hypothetical protein